MKKITIFFIVFLFSATCYGQDIQAPSGVSSVIIYPDSAIVNRLASLKLEKGEHSVYFSDIIPEIDENSLRVSGKGTADVKIFGAQLKKEFLEQPQSQKIAQLRDEIQNSLDYIKSIDEEIGVLSKEREFLESIRLFSAGQFPKDLVTKMPQVSDLENTAKFLTEKLSSNYKKQLSHEKEKREVNKKINVLQKELSQLTSQINLVKRSIVVDMEVTKAGTLDLTVSYLVNGVSWNMVYDARVAFKDKKVELISYGIIKQKTGEDWQDVEVSLSTAKPSIGGRMPYISPWFIKPYEQIARRYQTMAGTAKLKMSDERIREQYQAMAPTANALLSEEDKIEEAAISFAQTEQRGTAVVYKIAKKATIKSDGSEHKLPITSQALEADFQYSACPKISSFAYLGCRVTNSKDLLLLAGRVNVFLENDYVGASSIDNIGQGESFDLYLGVDEGVKVERKEIEKKVDETLMGGIASSNKKISYKYKLTAENYKADKIKLNLFEPIPVSQDDRIAVKIGKVSINPLEKDWQDRKGIWKWEVGLDPKEKKEVYFDYVIEHPRTMQVEGL